MARAVITIDDACDPCWTKSKTATESIMDIELDGKTWFFCAEHEKALARELVKMLGDPGEDKS
ncbi:hypothetical protein ABZ154_09370 [Streptomyces sp. NPDC006261]|uniref:hypothetical protein n=1 Tax=Streptomyces sp. NPDC006261 TaxID=3156739 RepID=UPI0033AA92BC